MNVFEAVKQSVTTRQAAERYGIKVNRNGMCVCPFHNDKNPSMKVDRRFYCFRLRSHRGRDRFCFPAPWYQHAKQAALMLAQDFSIPYEDGRNGKKQPIRATALTKKKTGGNRNSGTWSGHCFRVLSDYYHLLRRWKEEYAPRQPDEAWNPRFVEALQNS